jgi:hypothetical protein
MTLYEFNSADEMEQIEAFWNGVLVGIRHEGAFEIECRQIDGFYVEYKIKDHQCVDIRAFNNPDLLQPYLDQMGKIEI